MLARPIITQTPFLPNICCTPQNESFIALITRFTQYPKNFRKIRSALAIKRTFLGMYKRKSAKPNTNGWYFVFSNANSPFLVMKYEDMLFTYGLYIFWVLAIPLLDTFLLCHQICYDSFIFFLSLSDAILGAQVPFNSHNFLPFYFQLQPVRWNLLKKSNSRAFLSKCKYSFLINLDHVL